MIKIIKISIFVISLLIALLVGAKFASIINSMTGQNLDSDINLNIPKKESSISTMPSQQKEELPNVATMELEQETSEIMPTEESMETIKIQDGDTTIQINIPEISPTSVPKTNSTKEKPSQKTIEDFNSELKEEMKQEMVGPEELQELQEEEIMQETPKVAPSSHLINNEL